MSERKSKLCVACGRRARTHGRICHICKWGQVGHKMLTRDRDGDTWEFGRTTHQHDENIKQHERQYHGESFNGAHD
jgi:hypothetical protein